MSNSIYKKVIFSGDEYKNQLDYWLQNLGGDLRSVQLPNDYKKTDRNAFEVDKFVIQLPEDVTNKILSLSKSSDLNIYIVLLAALNSYLFRYTGGNDIIIGSPLFNCTYDSFNKLVILRNLLNNNMSFKDILINTKKVAMDAYNNQDYPIDMVFEKLGLDSEHIADTVNIYFTYKGTHNYDYSVYDYFDLFFIWERKADTICGELVYNTCTFTAATIRKIADYYVKALECFINNINNNVSELDKLFENERQNILHTFNNNSINCPSDKVIHELFEEQVEKAPDKKAVVYNDEVFTYKQLNEKANQLARLLRSKGAEADNVIAIMVERSLDMITGIMGILKSGAAYMPIDPDYPKERIEYMLKDCRARILITQKHLRDKVVFQGETICLQDKEMVEMDNSNIEGINKPDNLAYVIYTSGSTGKPKGVMIENHSVINLVYGLKQVIYGRFNEDLNVSMLSPYVFDASVKQIFPSLLLGHTLFIIPEEVRLNGKDLLSYCNRHHINIMDGTPTHLKILLDVNKSAFNGSAIKNFVIGGEEISRELAKSLLEKFKESKPVITNVYGPTECCDVTTTYSIYYEKLDELLCIPIGMSLANTSCYILNKDFSISPIGIEGELCIAGAGLSRGYLNQPQLTAEKFVENPFEAGTRMYRTGDLVRWMADGNIEFLGRIDQQVKIRGYRIELGEIESRLLACEGIKEAVVVAREDNEGNNCLCAYIVGGKRLTVSELRERLSAELPDYMIPPYFIQLDKLPLTPNGKIDRKALPEPYGSMTTGVEYEVPRNEAEAKLADIWKDVLRVNRVGINDDFFGLGGHSLKATSLVTKIHKAFNVQVPLKEIFRRPTIKGLSEYIKGQEENIYAEIQPVEEREYYELSSAQKRLYTLQQFEEGSTAYNIPGVLIVEGELDTERLKDAFKKLIERHESLRTSLEIVGEEIVQKVHKKVEFEIERSQAGEEEVEGIVGRFVRAFDLSKAPLLRVGLIKVQPEKHILMYDMHHIISDGSSMGILVNEFVKLYEGRELGKLRIQYKDFSNWQNELFKTERIKSQEEYWIKEFEGEIPVLNLPTDYPRPAIQSFEGDRIYFELNEEITEGLRKIAKETGTTMYMVLLAGFNILLSKYSGQEDIIVGSPIAGRPHGDLENIIGMFVNTLAIRNYPEGRKTFREFLEEVKVKCLKAYENQDYQFEELVEKLDVRRDMSRNPLFDVMLVLQNIEMGVVDIKGLSFRKYEGRNRVSKFDMTINAVEGKDKVELGIEYCTKLFTRDTIEQFGRHLTNILEDVISNTEKKLYEIEILEEDEKNKLLYEFNDTYAEYPKDKTIHELFEEQANKTPDNIAVVYENSQLTYRELNEKSNQLARVLREKGVGPDSIVGIMAERSLEMIVGIMSILKAGGAYLPIDSEYPKDRIEYMLEDSRACILFTQKHLRGNISFSGEVINLDGEQVYVGDSSNLEIVNRSSDLAYVIYTSGSTGRPKGVMIEHKALSNFIGTICDRFDNNFGESDKCLSLTSISFDVSVAEIFLPVTKGCTLVLYSGDRMLDIAQLGRTIAGKGITFTYIPPSILKELNKELQNEAGLIKLNKMLVGVEPIKDYVLGAYLDINKDMQIVNGYGPTEATICATMYKYTESKNVGKNVGKNVPIGSPMNNTRIYIVDKANRLQPVGVAGELCIAGDGLARGYLNRRSLTDEKFIENPFIHGERIYRTGDLARWLSDGNIEFLGRIDHQVKIRGFRIELGEVESCLLKYEAVKEAVVVAKEDENSSKYLCAYIVGEKELILGELREHLGKELPDYMIPSYFVQLESIPLTPNGKVDRKALPEPNGSMIAGAEYEAPRNEIEEKLVKIWQEVLGIEKIGINDSFFDLGGHSLKATSMAAKIHKELNVEVLLKEIFSTPTIKGLSRYIAISKHSKYKAIEAVGERDYYPVSSAQNRLWILKQANDNDTSYNMTQIASIEGELDRAMVEAAFEKLIERHEILRTSFEYINAMPVQKVNKDAKLDISYTEAKEGIDEIITSFIKPFDLGKAPLLRVLFIKIEKSRHIMAFDMHHIISDGLSMDIITKEFTELYQGRKLPEQRIQYKDYCVWHNDLLESGILKSQEEYWKKKLDNFIYSELPKKNKVPQGKAEGARKELKLDKETTARIEKYCKKANITQFTFMLGIFKLIISKYSGQNDITVGIPIAGRNYAELDNMIGLFLNVLIIRTLIKTDLSLSFSEYLKLVEENILEAQDNQDYPYEKLFAHLKETVNFNRPSIFSILFNYMPYQDVSYNFGDIVITPYEIDAISPKYDITLYLREADEISISLVYKDNLYDEFLIKSVLDNYSTLINILLDNDNMPIRQIDLGCGSAIEECALSWDEQFNNMEEISLQNRISRIAQKTPDKKAVEWGKEYITYLELEQNSNRIANFLTAYVGEEKRIPVIMEQSIGLIEGLLGIIKSGNIFVPIDPNYPANRIKTMIKEIGSDWMLAQAATLQQIEAAIGDEDNAVNVILLEPAIYPKENAKNLNIFQIDSQIEKNYLLKKDILNKHCYIYFTSGSTGKPKGILGRHRSLDHFIQWEISEFGVNEDFRVSQLTSPSFDPFLRDVFVPLCAGGTLCIPDNRDIILDPERLVSWIEKNQITLVHMVPALFKNMVPAIEAPNYFDSLRYIMLAGEILRGNDIRRFIEIFGDRIQLVNLYGPTETTLVKFYYRIKSEDIDKITIPVGKPITFTEALILDNDLNKCVINGIGEIFIHTPFISSGYFNDTELTKKVFIKNPFSSNEQDIIYKTGDMGRLLADENIEVIGRIDSQVKIRGSRIETAEVENQLLKHEAVKEAVVAALEDKNGDKYLCAYVTGDRQLMAKELREYLNGELPEYMIPSYFAQLDKLPLTPNGKIDRKALPVPNESMIAGAEYEAPRNETEEKLVRIWQEVIGVDRIGINDNFFDLGGHSLKATSMISKIHKVLNVEVPLGEVFKIPTIKGLSEYIKGQEENIYAVIEPVKEKEYYGLSSAQKRIYTLQQFDPESTGYNIPKVLEIEGKLEVERLEGAFSKLIERHEAFRTSFKLIGEEIVQRIHKEVELDIEHKEAGEEDIEAIVRSFMRPFDLSKAPLLRVGLIKLHSERHILLLDMHHIISDGTSLGILTGEFVKLYQGQGLTDLRLQYKDYAAWQNDILRSDVMKKQEEYWLKAFEGEIPALSLATDYQRPSIQSFEGDSIRFELSEEITRGLRRVGKETGATMYMVLLAGFNILLSKYSGQDDIVVGSPLAGRPHADLENIIGMFVNTLAMRNYPESSKTVRKFIEEVKANALSAYENQDYQFEELVEKLNVRRDMSRNPVFDVMFVMQNIDIEKAAIEGIGIKPYKLEKRVSKFDITLIAVEVEEKIGLGIEYCSKLFNKETIERMAGHLKNVLKDITQNTGKRISEIEMLGEEERHKLLYEFNDTYAKYLRDKTIHELFEKQVDKTPDNIAVVYKDSQLTYRELNEKSNQLARVLREMGVVPDSIVGIMVERSLEMIVGIMGILKAGGAYLPIDPEYPAERIEYMIKDSNVKVVITNHRDGSIHNLNNETVYLDEKPEADYPRDNVESLGSNASLAYIIYTSGSTGKPKGVMVEHRTIVNTLQWCAAYYDLCETDAVLQIPSFSFDSSVEDIFSTLITGGKLVLLEQEKRTDVEYLREKMQKEKVTHFLIVPSFYTVLAAEGTEDLQGLRFVTVAGEACTRKLVEQHFRKLGNTRLFNEYGPTENSVCSTVYEIKKEKPEALIGKPISNCKCYIVGKNNNLLQPVGVEGELFISGAGLARGYLNRPELTAEKFVENPFEPGTRMYRTGDLARWLPDGNIEFLGRVDHQVKIRGYRIELGEIENHLLKYEAVKDAIVVAREDKNYDKYLCAYLTADRVLSVSEIREYLGKELPEYMIPTYFVQLDRLPLTPNGKVDRKALPESNGGIDTGVEYEAPRNEIEEKLVRIWQEILRVDKIGIKDSFFELGGNSINIIRMVSLINNEIGIELKMADLFVNKTIEGLSGYINETELKNRLKSVQKLNKSKSGENVFILHPLHGSIYGYKDLAKLLEEDFQVYGIQAKGLDGSCNLAQTIDEMVEDYIKEIEQVQSEGPYIIVGYCIGNIIGYEITRVLEERKEKTGKYINIDGSAFIPDKILWTLKTKEKLFSLPGIYKKSKFVDESAITKEETKPEVSCDMQKREARDREAMEAYLNKVFKETYRTRGIIKTPTFIIKAEETESPRLNEKDWNKMVKNDVKLVEIPGNHESILAHPWVERLADEIEKILKES